MSQNCKQFDILKQFPSITKYSNAATPVKHNTAHIILPQGQPVSSNSRRLPPDKLKCACVKRRNYNFHKSRAL